MKRKITTIMALLASSLMLASCSEAESFIKSYLDNSKDQSQTDASKSGNGQSNNDQSSNWTQTDLALMQTLFTDYVLPYPQGLTESHESSIESDDNGDYLYIYDGACNEEIAGSYTQILEDSGYTYDSTSEGYDIYYSETDGIVIQFGYFTENEVGADEEYGFYCLAWVDDGSGGDESYQTYGSFPYEAIGTFFGTTADSTMIPSFEIASGESYYGAGLDMFEEFIVYGYYDNSKTSTQMISAYTSAVKTLGYTTNYDSDYDYYEATGSSSGFSLYYYVQTDTDGSECFCLEIAYGEDEEMVEYDSFPYSAIASYFGRTSVTSSQIPSFSIMSNTSYYGLGSESAGIKYFAVGGYIAESTTTSTMIQSYTNSLKALGYTTGYYSDDDLYYGESTTLGFSIYYYTEEQTSSTGTDNVFYIMIYDDGDDSTDDPSTPGGDDNQQTVTGKIEISPDNFSASYPASLSTITISKANFKYESIMKSDGNIQFRSSKRGSGILYNTTPLSISKATITYDSTKFSGDYFGELSVYVANTALTTSTGGKLVTPTKVDNVYTYDFGGTYSYIYMIDETDYASYCDSISLS